MQNKYNILPGKLYNETYIKQINSIHVEEEEEGEEVLFLFMLPKRIVLLHTGGEKVKFSIVSFVS